MPENGENRERIVEQVTELFLRYGIRSVSMDDIASHLGVSKKTLYQVFEDKDDLVLAVTRAHLEKQSAEFESIVNTADNEIDELLQFSVCLRKSFKNMNPSLLFDLHKFHKKAWDTWIGYKQEVIRRRIADMINRGKTNGYFRAEIDPEIIAIFRVEQVQMVFDERVYPRNRFDFTGVQMQLFEHFVHGLLTEKGEKLYRKLITKAEQIQNPL